MTYEHAVAKLDELREADGRVNVTVSYKQELHTFYAVMPMPGTLSFVDQKAYPHIDGRIKPFLNTPHNDGERFTLLIAEADVRTVEVVSPQMWIIHLHDGNWVRLNMPEYFGVMLVESTVGYEERNADKDYQTPCRRLTFESLTHAEYFAVAVEKFVLRGDVLTPLAEIRDAVAETDFSMHRQLGKIMDEGFDSMVIRLDSGTVCLDYRLRIEGGKTISTPAHQRGLERYLAAKLKRRKLLMLIA